jgi:uncharacterized protein with FMN-binding domain
MSYKLWKTIQRFSYIIYASLFGHVIVLGSGENTVYYILLFGLYSALKIYCYLFINYKKTYKMALSIFIFTLIVMLGSIYTGGSYGYKDYRVLLTVTIENGEIVAINVIEDGSSSPRNINYSEVALYTANQIIDIQSTGVDNIAGATHTVEGIIDAVLYALETAKE